eukprot:TRINITY_DN4478_c0_g2_i1.p1 TRINITY_DN4478_c0_g2~~TRINITY_DN4478_c0_g2_i1.p1  ORF type:complete len:583 (-),score=113.16 TRINITY_DN4478_c0_g2_i1:71-1759(-)
MPAHVLNGVLVAVLASQATVAIEAPPCAAYGVGYNDPFRNEVPNGGLLATANDCQRVCQNTVFCERFTFYNNSGGCWLQGNNWTEVVSPYIISGPVLCPGEVRPGEIGPFGPLSAEAQEVWASVLDGNVTIKHNMAAGSTTINTGLTDAELVGKVVVVHDVTGARVSCSPLLEVAGKLVANAFTPYPGYAGPLTVTGSVDFDAPEVKTEQAITYSLRGTDPKCGAEDITGVVNACGIHIHEGQVCTDAGGHFYNHTTDTTDPWMPVTYETMGAYPTKELAALGSPTAVAEQDVDGKNFIYTWSDKVPPVNITVLRQVGGNLELTDVVGLPEPEIKAREAVEGAGSSGGFPWWAWLLIVLGIVILAGVIYALCFGGSKKKSDKKKESGSSKSKIAARDLESAGAEKTPLMRETPAGEGAPSGITSQGVSGAQMNMPLGPAQMQSPIASAGQPVIPSTASPVAMAPVSAGMPQYASGGQPVVYSSQPMVMSGAQPMVMSGAQPMVMSGAQPMVMPGAQPMVMSGAQPVSMPQAMIDANALFDQLDTDGDGTISRQELQRLQGRM